MSDNKEAIAKAPRGRVQRTPVGTRNVLTVAGKEAGYEYRIINDSGDRVQEFLDAGYEIVSNDSVRVGDKRVNAATAEGSKAQLSVGQGQKAYVVRIKKEWYDEDQAAKQVHVNKLEEATKAKALDGTYGKLEISRG
jgi:regulator of protease activity HflC (stomatin/prohibitin superfamily)